LDADDDWGDESVYVKANPSLGQIVQPKFLHDRLEESKLSMTTQVDFKIKNLDIFVTAKNIWLSPEIVLDTYQKIDYEKLIGEPCYCGADLSSTSDLTAFGACWPPNEYRDYLPDKYILKVMTWVPQCALETSNGTLYEAWIHSHLLKMTSGNSVDYQTMLMDILEFNNNHPIMKFHYDEWNATSFTQAAVAAGLNMIPMSQSLGSFNRPTKAMEIMMKNHEIVIDGNPLISWAFQNCELKLDMYGNCKPVKANGQITRKIDPIIAMLEALAGYLFEQLFGTTEMLTLES
jgi:phage terminase large subunit-like protein